MDPRNQECFGQYLFGAGWFARDDNTLGLLTGRKSPPHFCLQCPKRKPCEAAHERQVREDQPAAVERYERLMREGIRRGAGKQLIKLLIGRNGDDPFANEAMENFTRGHAERGQEAGPLVQ